MFDIFDPIVDLISFIGSIFSAIYEGIYGLISIFTSFFNLLFSIIRILPNPLYPCFLTFLTLISTIIVYKIFRKG